MTQDSESVVVPREVFQRVVWLADALASVVSVSSSETQYIVDAYAVLAAAPSTSVREEELDRLRKLALYASDGPWEIDSEWNEDGEYGGGPNPGRGYDDYLIIDAQGRTLFGSENSTAKMIEVEYDEDGGTAWDQVARRNAEFIVACVAYVRAALKPSTDKGDVGHG